MTPDELTRLKELHDAATPAPWYFNPFGSCAEIVDADNALVLGLGYARTLATLERLDATVMVESRNALPGLLDHIEKLTRRLEIYEARLGRVARHHPEAYAEALAGGVMSQTAPAHDLTDCPLEPEAIVECGEHLGYQWAIAKAPSYGLNGYIRLPDHQQSHPCKTDSSQESATPYSQDSPTTKKGPSPHPAPSNTGNTNSSPTPTHSPSTPSSSN